MSSRAPGKIAKPARESKLALGGFCISFPGCVPHPVRRQSRPCPGARDRLFCPAILNRYAIARSPTVPDPSPPSPPFSRKLRFRRVSKFLQLWGPGGGRIPPPPVADEGGRRPNEAQSAASGSADARQCRIARLISGGSFTIREEIFFPSDFLPVRLCRTVAPPTGGHGARTAALPLRSSDARASVSRSSAGRKKKL